MSNDIIEINHEVEVYHPGEIGAIHTILTEIQNKDSVTIGYAMNVESVICLEEVCKVIPVRLYWNSIGVYQKYVLEEGATLEKYEADFFEPEDYKKLHSVLANTNSPFKDVEISEVLTVVDHGDEDVDAVSGATALELDEKDTVPGAALTCYTLWHWANGEIVKTIRKTTGESSTNSKLFEFIVDDNISFYPIALEALKERKNYEIEYVEPVIKRVSLNDTLIKSSITYLESAPIEVYSSALKEVFINGGKLQRIAVMRSLQHTKREIPRAYFDSYNKEMVHLKSFQEFSVFLGLMEDKNPNSEQINKGLIPFLDGNFLIARRVYWYLSEQNNLNANQQDKLQQFFEKHEDRL
ncbi:hypothetical protein [Seonamhaeicola maritimus]|uniref:Uncharacterized protein n=1 Tax=Seonamhaeicola maritimus TaxID=2591822 RepID=A0A5C7GEL4_9FLAO|nr:hypothetical protein [Seonamhaeicola maritimus]TXG35167.1 hypothetical protein FUA22_15550 [Seonamhaeicola maritimus]